MSVGRALLPVFSYQELTGKSARPTCFNKPIGPTKPAQRQGRQRTSIGVTAEFARVVRNTRTFNSFLPARGYSAGAALPASFLRHELFG